jgi:hypothetical protein
MVIDRQVGLSGATKRVFGGQHGSRCRQRHSQAVFCIGDRGEDEFVGPRRRDLGEVPFGDRPCFAEAPGKREPQRNVATA